MASEVVMLCLSAFCWDSQRSWFSEDSPKIYKLPREKHSVARKSSTLLTCYFKSECCALDFAAETRWQETKVKDFKPTKDYLWPDISVFPPYL